MFKSFVLSKPSPNVLEIKKTRLRPAFIIIGTIAFFTIWYLISFKSLSSLEIEKLKELIGSFAIEKLKELVSTNWSSLLFLIVPLAWLPMLIRNMKIVLIEQKFSFNSLTKNIEKNGSKIARFDDISKVKIRNIDSEGGDNYRLSLVLKDEGKTLKKKIRIGEGSKNEIYDVAEDIENILGIGEATDGGAGTAPGIVQEPKIQSPQRKTEITSHSTSPTKDQKPKVKPHKNMNSVLSLSPEYPKYRNAVIISCVILILIAFAGGGYFLTRHKLKKGKNLIEPNVTRFKKDLPKAPIEVKKDLTRDEEIIKDYTKAKESDKDVSKAPLEVKKDFAKGKVAIKDYTKPKVIDKDFSKAPLEVKKEFTKEKVVAPHQHKTVSVLSGKWYESDSPQLKLIIEETNKKMSVKIDKGSTNFKRRTVYDKDGGYTSYFDYQKPEAALARNVRLNGKKLEFLDTSKGYGVYYKLTLTDNETLKGTRQAEGSTYKASVIYKKIKY